MVASKKVGTVKAFAFFLFLGGASVSLGGISPPPPEPSPYLDNKCIKNFDSSKQFYETGYFWCTGNCFDLDVAKPCLERVRLFPTPMAPTSGDFSCVCTYEELFS